jgi:hypothetical protein
MHTPFLVTNMWQYHYRMSRTPFCCCYKYAFMSCCKHVTSAVMVKNGELITNCGWFWGIRITLT